MLLTDLVSETRECERHREPTGGGLVSRGGESSFRPTLLSGDMFAVFAAPGAGDCSGSSVLSPCTVAASADSRLGGIGPSIADSQSA